MTAEQTRPGGHWMAGQRGAFEVDPEDELLKIAAADKEDDEGDDENGED